MAGSATREEGVLGERPPTERNKAPGRKGRSDRAILHDGLYPGTDSPWTDQKVTLDLVRSLNLDAEREEKLLGGNARRLLGL